MSLNINLTTRRKQMAVLIGVLAVAGTAAAGIMAFGQNDGQGKPKAAATPAPNLTGVVSANFDDKLQTSVMQQQQAATSALQQQVQQLVEIMKQNKDDFDRKLADNARQMDALMHQGNGFRPRRQPPAPPRRPGRCRHRLTVCRFPARSPPVRPARLNTVSPPPATAVAAQQMPGRAPDSTPGPVQPGSAVDWISQTSPTKA